MSESGFLKKKGNKSSMNKKQTIAPVVAIKIRLFLFFRRLLHLLKRAVRIQKEVMIANKKI